MTPTAPRPALALLVGLASCGHTSAPPPTAAGAPPAQPAPAAPPATPVPTTAPTSAVEIIPRAALFDNPTRAAPKLSNDGRWLAWLAPRDGVMNVWVAPVRDLAAARPITEEKSRPIRQYFWAESPDTVLYLNDRGGDENFLLYATNAKTGKVRLLTPFEKTRVRLIATSKRRRNEILIGLNNRDPRYHDAHRLNLATGKLQLMFKNEGWGQLLADDSLTLRVATKPVPGGDTAAYRLSPKGEPEANPFLVISMEDSLTTAFRGFTTDGKTLLMSDSRDRDTAALVALSWPGGKPRTLGENPKADIGDALLHPVTGVPEAYSVNYLKTEYFPIGDAVKADLAFLSEHLKGEWSVVSRAEPDRLWVIGEDAVTWPYTYYLYDRAAKTLTKLFTSRPELEGKPLVPMQGVELRARDGLSLTAFVTLPPGSDPDGDGRPDRPVPMVLNVHGGPWGRDVYGYDGEAQWLANRGYAHLQVNFRGSSGFGKQFLNRANGEFAGKMHDDLLDAVAWAVEQMIAVPDRVAIYGGSYGGYAVLVGLTFSPDTFACGVDIVGPSNLVTLIESFPPYWQPFLERTWYKRVGDPRTPEGRDFLLQRSPITRVDRIRRPLLIAQGANDPRVTQKESDSIAEAMKAKNIPVTYVLYADEGHGFARPENRMSFYAISETFLTRCLGGRAEPMGAAFTGAKLSVPVGIENVPGLADIVH